MPESIVCLCSWSSRRAMLQREDLLRIVRGRGRGRSRHERVAWGMSHSNGSLSHEQYLVAASSERAQAGTGTSPGQQRSGPPTSLWR